MRVYEVTSNFAWKKSLFCSSLLFSLHHLENIISSSLASLLCQSNHHSFVGNVSCLFFFLWHFLFSLIIWNIIRICLGVGSIFIVLHETYCSSSTWDITSLMESSQAFIKYSASPLFSFILSSGTHIGCTLELFILFSVSLSCFLKRLYIFRAVLDWQPVERKLQKFHKHSCKAFPIISITHPSGTFFTKDDPILTHQNHPKSIVYLRIHSWCCTFYRFAQMYKDINPSL